MASFPQFPTFKNLFLISLFASSFFLLASSSSSSHTPTNVLGRRNLLEKSDQFDDDDNNDVDISSLPKKNKSPSSSSSSTSTSSKNQTKLIKPSSSSKNQTKLTTKPPPPPSSNKSSQKNQTKSISTSSSSSSKNKTKLTKPTPNSSTKNVGASLDPLKSSKTTNKTKSSPTTKITKSPLSSSSSHTPNKPKQTPPKTQNQIQTQNKKSFSPPTWMMLSQTNDEEDYDFMAEIRDLPTKFHQTFVPDIHKISTTSKIYLNKANNQITQNFIKPYVTNKYASSVSTAISCAFIIVPFLLVSLLFNQITTYFSLQRLIIFTQVYLSIYFSILCLSCLITGLEPLKFFYSTSESTYVWLQVLQTLGYVMYLLMLLMNLILVFSTESGLGLKVLGLAQTVVGFAIGLHYYVTVFHRVVLHQPPKTNWKVHGIYATCFLVICLLARAEKSKKDYLQEAGEEGKLN